MAFYSLSVGCAEWLSSKEDSKGAECVCGGGGGRAEEYLHSGEI